MRSPRITATCWSRPWQSVLLRLIRMRSPSLVGVRSETSRAQTSLHRNAGKTEAQQRAVALARQAMGIMGFPVVYAVGVSTREIFRGQQRVYVIVLVQRIEDDRDQGDVGDAGDRGCTFVCGALAERSEIDQQDAAPCGIPA
jgi:hypothetical protein